ncbi:MAG: SMC family ATPase [Firmicutes bacterium]|nr:SMC family ATPase [Bacillota bacterium]
MKPINLKIKGINSYVSEQSVDFNKLAANKIFGIFGETGSGKTTILDSIILALYGVTDRDTLQNIINVNTKDAYVEFTFEMEQTDGKINKYFVRRDYKLRPSGLKADAILNDLTHNKTLAEMPDNVNNKILEIIGIGKKEFTKCIALPQGEFDKFLSDTPAVRKKTLAKLFDLEQFGTILTEKLKKRKSQVSLSKSTLEEKIGVYNGISQDIIDKTVKILKDGSKQEKALTIQIARDKKLAEQIKDELAVKQELLDIEVNLNIKQSELTDINFIEKQIEYTQKYGDYTILTTKFNNCIDEIENLNDVVTKNQQLVINNDEELKKLNILKEDNAQKTNEIGSQLSQVEVLAEKKALHDKQMQELKSQKEETSQKLTDISQKILATNNDLKTIKSNILDLEHNFKQLETQIFDNMDTIDKLNNCETFKTKQDFALFLTITRSKINPDSLAEVENFNIHDEVMQVTHDLENYELGVRKEISDILKDLSNYEIDLDNLQEIKKDILAQNEKLNDKCDKIEDAIVVLKEKQASTKSSLESLLDKQNELNDSLQKIKSQIETLKVQDVELPAKDIDYLNKTLAMYQQEAQKLDDKITKLVATKQKAIIDIEVATTNIENNKDKLNTLNTQLKPYNKTTFQERVDKNLLLNPSEIESLQQKVDDYKKELQVLESNAQKLREKSKDYIYSKSDYSSLIEDISKNEEKLTDLKVFINVNQITLDIQKQNLETVLILQKDLDSVNKDYNAIEQLEAMLSGGALIDFVAEEYMGLITEFANSYVYKISNGKYLLNYDGDFNVIDNFNGGIKRSVKTLSGGERFIVSLSLALGISQSIAVNNNKNFNFFFIDEGFGNLSENYIEKVLQSFDALIKLNFTVGFITHVEKMEYYLNNRIVVTKTPDDGSKIEQYY